MIVFIGLREDITGRNRVRGDEEGLESREALLTCFVSIKSSFKKDSRLGVTCRFRYSGEGGCESRYSIAVSVISRQTIRYALLMLSGGA